MKTNRRLPIGAVAEFSGVGIETIRYYERIGLLAKPDRSPGGHRLYDHNESRRLRLVRRARDLGFTLNEIRELLRMARGEYTCGEVRALAGEHLKEVHRKISELKEMERRLAAISARCEQPEEDECPVLDALLAD